MTKVLPRWKSGCVYVCEGQGVSPYLELMCVCELKKRTIAQFPFINLISSLLLLVFCLLVSHLLTVETSHSAMVCYSHTKQTHTHIVVIHLTQSSEGSEREEHLVGFREREKQEQSDWPLGTPLCQYNVGPP